jgi:hypothetical protein
MPIEMMSYLFASVHEEQNIFFGQSASGFLPDQSVTKAVDNNDHRNLQGLRY